jgi:hypothetical protein
MTPLYSKKGRLHLMVSSTGTGFVDEFAEVDEDGLGEGFGFGDVERR